MNEQQTDDSSPPASRSDLAIRTSSGSDSDSPDQSRSGQTGTIPAGSAGQASGGNDRPLLARIVDIFTGKGSSRPRNGENDLHERIEEIIESTEEESGADPAFAHERALLTNILKLSDMTAYDVMVPRAEISAVSDKIGLDEIVSLACEASHSRFPVYQDSLDNVIGMIHIKDVLACMRSGSFDSRRVLRPLLFVAPSMRVLDLLWKMRLSRRHMALVVDEYGGIDGLVTIEDLVETIVGEIEDEHDQTDVIDFVVGQDGSVLADARTEIAGFEERFGSFLTDDEREDDIDTLGGLVFYLAGRVPARRELLTHDSGLTFEILEADPRRVKRLRIRGLERDEKGGCVIPSPAPSDPGKNRQDDPVPPSESRMPEPETLLSSPPPPENSLLALDQEADETWNAEQDDNPVHGRVAVQVDRQKETASR